MKLHAPQFLSVFTAALLLTGAISVKADPIPMGLHRSVLVYHEGGDLAAAHELIREIAGSGAESIRLSVRDNRHFDLVAQHIKWASELGLKVMLQVAPITDSDLYPKGVRTRSVPEDRDLFHELYPISKIDTEAYRTWIRDFITALNRIGAKPDVIQVGNELNWAGFNGDYAIQKPDEGIVYGPDTTWNDLPESVRTGVRQCGRISQITQESVRELMPEATPTVILGSLNKPHPRWTREQGGTFVHPEIFLKIVQGKLANMPKDEQTNLLSGLGGISVHFYVEINWWNIARAENVAKQYLADFMEPIVQVTDLPVYITEFGFRRTSFKSEEDRALAFRVSIKEMNAKRAQYHLEDLTIFSWDQGVYRLLDEETKQVHPAIREAIGW